MAETVTQASLPYPAEASGAVANLFDSHCTGSTGPTTNAHDSAPASKTTAVAANAQKKCPVRWTTNPVSAGETIPAKFPAKF